MLTDDEILEIARPYIRLMGDHWSYERGIHEDNVDEFARDIVNAVMANITADIIAACSLIPKENGGRKLLEDTIFFHASRQI